MRRLPPVLLAPLGALLASLLIGACASTPDEAGEGEAPRKGSIPEAPRCEAGDQAACADLGLRYARGDGVVKDEARANQLLEGACNANVARGCAFLAGRLVAQSQYERAYTLADRACVGGDGVGCHHLAGLYERGLGGAAKNVARAHELYVKSCAANVAQGCLQAASIEERGADGTVAEAQAAMHYQAACKADIPSACLSLARLQAFGEGVPRDLAAARATADAACKAGQSAGCGTLGLMTLEATPNDAAALAQVERACSDGQRAFCLALAGLVRAGRAPGDEVRQRTLLRQACDAGWKAGCDGLQAPLQNAPPSAP